MVQSGEAGAWQQPEENSPRPQWPEEIDGSGGRVVQRLGAGTREQARQKPAGISPWTGRPVERGRWRQWHLSGRSVRTDHSSRCGGVLPGAGLDIACA